MCTLGDLQMKHDVFLDARASCSFVRFGPGHARDIRITATGRYGLTTCASGGWLLAPLEEDRDAYWLPLAPRLRRLDGFGHVLEEHDVEFRDITIGSHELTFQVKIPDSWSLDWPIWQLHPGARNLEAELQQLHPVETQGYFLWGSHTRYRRPSDLYLHLIHGHVYENRFSWPKYWKICSENDAHALCTLLRGLELATGKQLYRLLRAQILLSVISRQGKDGGWRHGEWSDGMESHYRLHCSGMHMLMDALSECDDPALRQAFEHAAAFLSLQIDELDIGAWFLHDELEHRVETMRDAPFRWLPSRALGKLESNMLVLNTHLDATTALDRYADVTGDARYRSLVTKSEQATRAVLAMRPAEWLYRPIYKAIRWTFLPTSQAQQLSWHQRALKRVAWKYLIPLLPHIKARYPRLVMPGGYIERELSLKIFASEYLPINLMDLLRYRRRFLDDCLDAVIRAGLDLVEECHLLDRWPEIKGSSYAAAFWAEALYHACLLYTDARYRALLAQAVIKLDALSLGLAPSLFGANGEAVAPADQVPTPVVTDGGVRVVNLCRKDAREILLVNGSSEVAPLQFVRNAPSELAWTTGSDGEPLDGLPQHIPAGAWLWGRGIGRT